jgi:hypothetical protein
VRLAIEAGFARHPQPIRLREQQAEDVRRKWLGGSRRRLEEAGDKKPYFRAFPLKPGACSRFHTPVCGRFWFLRHIAAQLEPLFLLAFCCWRTSIKWPNLNPINCIGR